MKLIFKKKPIENKNGKYTDALKELKGVQGIYFLYEDKKLVYIGKAKDLYNRITRHFQRHENDGKEERQGMSRRRSNYKHSIHSNIYHFKYIKINDSEELDKKEAKEILKYKPRDNKTEGKINLFTNEIVTSIQESKQILNIKKKKKKKKKKPKVNKIPPKEVDDVPF